MKRAYLATAVLVFPLMAAAQTNVTVAPRINSPGPATGIAPGFSLPGGFNPAAGLFDEFWNDPACTAELHLTDAQRKQLQDATLTQRLALIDGGAEALKAFTRLAALMEADQLDDAAYRQQVNNLAAATGKVVQDVGEMAVSPRRVLTLEQWRKLKPGSARSGLRPRLRPGLRRLYISRQRIRQRLARGRNLTKFRARARPENHPVGALRFSSASAARALRYTRAMSFGKSGGLFNDEPRSGSRTQQQGDGGPRRWRLARQPRPRGIRRLHHRRRR